MHSTQLPVLVIIALLAQGCVSRASVRHDRSQAEPRSEGTSLELTYASTFADAVHCVTATGEDGAFIVSGTTSEAPDTPPRAFLEWRDTDGVVRTQAIGELGETFGEPVLHPSGDVSVAVLISPLDSSPDDPKSLAVGFRRYSSAGTILQDVSIDPWRWQWLAPEAKCFDEAHMGVLTPSSVGVAPMGEALVVHAWLCGQPVTAVLDAELKVLWVTQLSPPVYENGFYPWSQVAADVETRRIVTVTSVDEDAVTAVGTALPVTNSPLGMSDFLVTVLNAEGKVLSAFWAGTSEGDSMPSIDLSPVGLVIASSFGFSLDSPEHRGDGEGDIGVALYDLEVGDARFSRVYDVADLDQPYAVASLSDGRFVVGGLTGRRVVRTGSTVSFPDALALTIGADGTLVDSARWGTARSDRVESIAVVSRASGPRLLLGGTMDAPITHTGDADRSLLYTKGFVVERPIR